MSCKMVSKRLKFEQTGYEEYYSKELNIFIRPSKIMELLHNERSYEIFKILDDNGERELTSSDLPSLIEKNYGGIVVITSKKDSVPIDDPRLHLILRIPSQDSYTEYYDILTPDNARIKQTIGS